MTFPLIFLLYIYFAFLAIWTILSLVGLYHLLRFGGRMIGTFLIGLVYVSGSIIIIFLSYSYLSTIDWQTQITVFDNLSVFSNMTGSPNLFK
jgi:ABC-type maltose transport system permease subunit